MTQYGGPHEHKGPEDFSGKGGGDDDEEEEDNMGSPQPNSHSPPERGVMSHNLHTQPGLQHMKHSQSSASPPMPNGATFHSRGPTPQPAGMSRPGSRASMMRRSSTSLAVPPQHTPPQAHMGQPSFAYTQTPPYYTPQQAAAMQQRGGPPPPHTQPPQISYSHAPPQHQHQQLQHAYMHDQRRGSLPPSYTQEHHQQHSHPQPPPPQRSPQPQNRPHGQQQTSVPRKPSPQANQGAFQSPPMPQPKPLAVHSKSHSIFTPIDDSRSLLAQHWGAPSDNSHQDHQARAEIPRSQTADIKREKVNGVTSHANMTSGYAPQPQPPQRTGSVSSVSSRPVVPTRSSTMQSDAKRPRLKVQIPSEASDGGEATADTSPQETSTSATMGNQVQQGKSVVLPPPSPSTNNPLLSAGASGPPNPFARPAPPSTSNPHLQRDHIETPLSALPSRVMDGNMLPSPSDLWSNAWFGRNNDSNMLPSPLNFQPTPINSNGPSFKEENEIHRKRKADVESAEAAAAAKRVRT